MVLASVLKFGMIWLAIKTAPSTEMANVGASPNVAWGITNETVKAANIVPMITPSPVFLFGRLTKSGIITRTTSDPKKTPSNPNAEYWFVKVVGADFDPEKKTKKHAMSVTPIKKLSLRKLLIDKFRRVSWKKLKVIRPINKKIPNWERVANNTKKIIALQKEYCNELFHFFIKELIPTMK